MKPFFLEAVSFQGVRLFLLKALVMNSHKFDVEDAKKHGVEKAILLEHLKFHQRANAGNDDMVIDGKTHAFIKPKTIKEMYPYLNYASVRRWLKELEEDGVIESCKPKARGGYHLKYYHVFPNDQNDQSNVQSEQSLNDQNDQSSNTTNVKNNLSDNNSEKKSLKDRIREKNPEAVEVAEFLLGSIKQWEPTHKYNRKEPAIGRWCKDIEKAMRIDGWTQEQLEYVIEYIFTQNTEQAIFWAPNIQSGKKLRKQMDQLVPKIKNEIKRLKKNGTSKTDKIKQQAREGFASLDFEG